MWKEHNWQSAVNSYVSQNVLHLNSLDSKGNYSATSNNTKLVHWSLMGGLLHLVQRGGDWAGCGGVYKFRDFDYYCK